MRNFALACCLLRVGSEESPVIVIDIHEFYVTLQPDIPLEMAKNIPQHKLPFGSELSPDVIHLPALLAICAANEGDKHSIEAAILEKFFSNKGGGSESNRNKIAMNCRLSLQNYLLLDSNFRLTDIGRKLYEQRDNEDLYKTFAKHILLNLNGLLFVQSIQEMQAEGVDVNLTSLRRGLAERNLHYPIGGKHPSIMRLWLKKAGVVIGNRWTISKTAIDEILGNNPIEPLSSLNAIQKGFLKALINSGVTEFQSASDIVKLATATYGLQFPEKSLPKLVLNKLVEEGFIEAVKTTEGRGAKPYNVRLRPEVNTSLICPILKQIEGALEPKLRELLIKPLSEIVEEIKSPDTYISGLALEALAFKLMRIIDLDYIGTRLRGNQTGGAEVDLLFESSRLVYSRWQIQCKNTAHVSLDPVAKEVGLTHFLKSNVIVVVTTGVFSADAVRYSNQIMRDSNLSIILLDKTAIELIIENPTNIVDLLNAEAQKAMQIKQIVL